MIAVGVGLYHVGSPPKNRKFYTSPHQYFIVRLALHFILFSRAVVIARFAMFLLLKRYNAETVPIHYQYYTTEAIIPLDIGLINLQTRKKMGVLV